VGSVLQLCSTSVLVFTARCMIIVQSAVLRLHVIRPSVHLSVTLGDHIGVARYGALGHVQRSTSDCLIFQVMHFRV